MSRKKTLVVLNDSFEARQALPYLEDSVVLCLSLEAESYVKNTLLNYGNPLHEVISKRFKKGDKSYYLRNFKIAHSWYKNKEPIFEYVQDSLGYFLTEFDRSLDLASYVIKKFNPQKIIIGEQRDYKGFEIIHGSLDSTAISLIAREKRLPLKFLKIKKDKASVRSIIGKLIAKTRFNSIDHVDSADLLLVIPGKHLAQMRRVVKELEKRVSVIPLTYGLDWSTRKKLTSHYANLLEKEHFRDSELKQKSRKRLQSIKRDAPWKNFVHPRYRKNKVISVFLQQSVKKIVWEEFEPILTDIYLSEYLLKSIKPKAILTTTDPDTKVLPYIKTAKRLRITTIGLQHGADFTKVNPVYYAASYYFIAWSKMAQAWAVKNIPAANVLVGYSPFHSKKKPIRRKIGRRFNILLLTTINYYERQVPYFLLKLLKTIEKQDDKINLTIRTHPFQPLENLKGLFTSKKIKTKWDKSTSLYESVRDADAVIFENTTAGLDAMLAQKPVIYFNPYDGDDYFSMRSKGIMTILTDKEIEPKICSFFERQSKWNDFSKKGYKFAIEYLGLAKDKDAKLAKLIINCFQG